jgi:hypothetical protein
MKKSIFLLLVSYSMTTFPMFKVGIFPKQFWWCEKTSNKKITDPMVNTNQARIVLKNIRTEKEKQAMRHFLEDKKDKYHKIIAEEQELPTIMAHMRSYCLAASKHQYAAKEEPHREAVATSIMELNNVVHENFWDQIKIKKQKYVIFWLFESIDKTEAITVTQQDFLYLTIANEAVKKCLAVLNNEEKQ